MYSTNAKFFPLLCGILLLDIFTGINVNTLIWGVFIATAGAVVRVCAFPFKGFWPALSGAIAGIVLGALLCYFLRDLTGFYAIVRDISTCLFGMFAPETVTGIKGPYKEAIKKRFKKFTDEL